MKQSQKKVEVYYSSQFNQSRKELPFNVIKKFIRKKRLFEKSPYHPTLRTHKLKGELKEYYSFSIDYSYRVLFKFMNKNKVLFIDIGTHEIYR